MFSSTLLSNKQHFPPETQNQLPGKQYIVHPLPKSINPDYKPSNKLQGKIALATGGDSGIGRAVCYYFTIEGATVAFTYVKGIEDKDKDDTLQFLDKAKAADAKDPIAIATDVQFEANCKKVVDQVVSEFGKIDILVNNAGEQQSLGLQLINKGIRVNAVAPGPVWTPLQPASLPAERVATLGNEVPILRAAQPYEIAPSYVFLAANECSSYITVQVVDPNGGLNVSG
ncbi:short chain dehydrogenase, putative [Ricinus communis]|uniref:Short chain dehydrogenase, putative n=1 Tax=Ricinus communis TaxID=3988 RepID=B9RTX0_RICCO|nr:short chain dehydrogenase, putative [Ricinus communis]